MRNKTTVSAIVWDKATDISFLVSRIENLTDALEVLNDHTFNCQLNSPYCAFDGIIESIRATAVTVQEQLENLMDEVRTASQKDTDEHLEGKAS